MKVVVLAEGSGDDQVGRRRVKEHATDEACFGRFLGKVDIYAGIDLASQLPRTVSRSHGDTALTVNVFRGIQVNPENSTGRQSQNQDIVGHLRRDEIGRYGELELNALDIEYRKGIRRVSEVAGSNIPARDIQRHRAPIVAELWHSQRVRRGGRAVVGMERAGAWHISFLPEAAA